MAQLKINEGFDANTGIQEVTHFQEGEIVVEKRFDAQPHLEYAAQARQATAGQRWGEGKLVGHLPPAFHAQVLMIRDKDERKKAVQRFFKENPAFVMFDRYGK
jgi:hypothetical protein